MKWVVLCDEVSALAWRLAGAEVVVADEHTLQAHFARVRSDAQLLFITADLARTLSDADLNTALLSAPPLIALIDAVAGGRSPPDVEREVNRVLGIAV